MLNFMIAPDFPPEDFAGWHLFNTKFQRLLERDIHLVTPIDHTEQIERIKQGDISLIYANPFDASMLVREYGYLPLVRPNNRPDEMVIASYADSPYHHSDELKAGCKILITDNWDIQLLGLRLLEPACIGKDDIQWVHAESYPEMARRLINKEADAAFFLASAYQKFRPHTLERMKPLMESKINDLTHVVMLHPDFAELHPLLMNAFVHMVNEPMGQMILRDLNIPDGFSELEEEDCEFLIDLIETLQD